MLFFLRFLGISVSKLGLSKRSPPRLEVGKTESRRIRSDRQLAVKSNDPFQREDIEQMGSGARETRRRFESRTEDGRSWKTLELGSCVVPRGSLHCRRWRGRGPAQAWVMCPTFAFGCCLILFPIIYLLFIIFFDHFPGVYRAATPAG